MTAGDGKPCKKCGTSEWGSWGNCKQCARDKAAKWREDNPGRNRENARKWRKVNLEVDRENSRRWYSAHAEYAKEQVRQWKQKHPERARENMRAGSHRYRAKKAGNGGSFTAAEWNALVASYGGRCLCCGRDDVKLTVDHVIPVSIGGSNNIDNIQPLCLSCNTSKKDKHIDYRPKHGILRWIQGKLFD